MSITFKARVLLELGAELISSDPVALYELIKNGVDAGSKKIGVYINIVMQPSSFRELVAMYRDMPEERWSTQKFLRDVVDRIEEDAEEEVKAEFIELVGEPRKFSTAVERLKEALFTCNYICIEDWGTGMDGDDMVTSYLTIGTPKRSKEKASLIQKGSTNKQLPLGEKGIGRLAAMRIGHYVHLQSSVEKRPEQFELELDWRPIFADIDLDASALDFHPVINGKKTKKHGTLITIRDIQNDWTIGRLSELAESDLAKLVDPFKSNFANQFLEVHFQGKRPEKLINAFHEPYLKHADAICTISFRSGKVEPGNKTAVLNVKTEYVRFKKDEEIQHVGEHLADSVSHPPSRRRRSNAKDVLPRSDEVIAALQTVGAFEAKFYWFNRGRLMRDEKILWQQQLGKFVRNWSGGMLVYRDGFRVYPYGSGADDWLDLDRKALASSAYKLNRAQIIGYLRIDSDKNGLLQDQTNREGFRDCPEKEALRRLLRQAIIGDCKSFLERVDKQNKGANDETIEDIDNRIADAGQSAVANLKKLGQRVPDEGKVIQLVLTELAEVQDAWGRAKEALASKDDEIEQYMHLAGVGLMVELLAHEFARTTNTALELLKGNKIKDASNLSILESQLKTLNRRVRVIDELSIPGRQRKLIHDVPDLVTLMQEFYESKLNRHMIDFEIAINPKGSFSRRVEKGQILQILDNLFNNSCYWLARRLDRNEKAKIRVVINPKLGTLEFADNGPGISDSVGDRVFDAFYTSKPQDGRGLGLYIAKRLAEENDMKITLLDAVDHRHPGFLLTFPGK